MPVLFLALTGVRRIEMLGLRRDSVDVDQAVVFIEEQQTRLLDGTVATKETKTSRRRIVTLSPLLVQALKIHLARTEGELLFPSPLGGPWKATSFNSNLAKACKPLGISVSPQRIRRAFSTAGDRGGAARKAIAEIMGHAVEVNARHYDDVSLADKRTATDLVAESVSKWCANLDLLLKKP